MQLPKTFSPKIKQLAQDITADAETPYDKASAITEYLRQNIEYAATVPNPPRNTDRLEWFLFDVKKGFCVYYASSEVTMLRALGIPARMAVGFAQGDKDGDNYTVRRLHAHAWPEVYFPGIGWVEFEPTASQPALNRPLPPRDPNELDPADPRNIAPLDDNGFANRDQGEDPGITAIDPAAPEPVRNLAPLADGLVPRPADRLSLHPESLQRAGETSRSQGSTPCVRPRPSHRTAAPWPKYQLRRKNNCRTAL